MWSEQPTYSVLLGEVLDHRRWIGAHRQQTDHRRSTVALLPHGSQVQDHRVGVLRTHRVGDVLARLRRRSVWTPRSSKHAATSADVNMNSTPKAPSAQCLRSASLLLYLFHLWFLCWNSWPQTLDFNSLAVFKL